MVPVVDVVIPVRAPAPWFRAALASLQTQTQSRWRLVVVMDGYSRDVEAMVSDLDIVVEPCLLTLPGGSGLVRTLNAGISACVSPYVARLDSDDICLPDRLETQVAYMKRNPQCVVVGSRAVVIDSNGTPIGDAGSQTEGSIIRELRWRSTLIHPSVLIRRDALLAVGGYRETAKHGEDFDLWLRLAVLGEIHNLPEQLIQYRRHASQVTQTARIPLATLEAIKESRLELAAARGESRRAAQIRAALFLCIQRLKGRVSAY